MAKFEGRPQIGSSMLRGEWLTNNSSNFETYKIGKKYDAYIYQKAYWVEHAQLITDAPKILDVCDPDWYNWKYRVVEMLQYIDAVTCSSQTLVEAIKKFTDKPVYFVPDRLDLTLPAFNVRKEYKEVKNVVWFGYSQNFKMIDACAKTLEKLGLNLTVISNTTYRPPTGVNLEVTNLLYNQENAYKLIQECDICINPQSDFGKFKFKSDNKTVIALALGLPVAKNEADLKRLAKLRPEELEAEIIINKKQLTEEYDIKLSIKQYEDIIAEINTSILSRGI